MAVYCPMYDPARGWYIIVCGPKGSYKQYISSPLYYYHSMGVKPPIGAKFTPEDYMEFDLDLEEADNIDPTELTPISLPPPMWIPNSSLFPAPIYTNSSQAIIIPVSDFDPTSGVYNPLLNSKFGLSSVYSPFHHPSASSATSSTKPLVTDTATLPPSICIPDSSISTAPISANSSQTTTTSVPKFDHISGLHNPLLNSKIGPSSVYSTFHNPSALSAPSSTKVWGTDNATLKKVSKLNKKLTAVELLLSSAMYGGKFGSLSLPTSPFTSSLPHPSSMSGAKISNNSPLKHPSTLSHLSPLASTSSNLSHHLHSPPTTSSGYVSVLPPIGTSYPYHAAAVTNSTNVNNYPILSSGYDDSMANKMYLDGVDKSAVKTDNYGS